MKRGWSRIALVLGIVIVNIVLDQGTKEWARQSLQMVPPESYLGDFFRLTYVENKGAFLSGGANMSEQLRYWVLSIFPALLLVGLLVYTCLSRAVNRWQIVGLAFVIGGGLSNIYDRFAYGQVVDFMNMGLFDIRTGIFNFADVSIMLGVGIMLPFAFRKAPPITEEAKVEEE